MELTFSYTPEQDVYHSVGEQISLGLLPQENSIYGTVKETYDLLRSEDLGHTKWIRGAVVLPVCHCLLVRKGRRLHDIQKVLSHEQVGLLLLRISPLFAIVWLIVGLDAMRRP